MHDILKDRKLNQIVLPGTHDSGTYRLDKELAPDAEDIVKKLWQFKAEGSFGIEDFILGWAKCQDLTIYEQLQSGIRYIDLRVCWAKNNFHTCHSLLGDPTLTLLSDMKKFLNENPKEILCIKVGFKKLDGTQEDKAKQLFKDTLGDLYAEAKPALSKTYGKIIETKERAFFDYGDCIRNLYPDKDTTAEALDRLKDFHEKGFNWATPNGDELLDEPQLQLTAQPSMFVESFIQTNGCRLLSVLPALMAVPVIGPILPALGITSILSYITYLKICPPVPRNNSNLADSSRSVCKDFFEWYVKGLTVGGKPIEKLPNLIICDYFNRMSFVDIAISMNKYKDTPSLESQINALTSKIENTWKPSGGGVLSSFLGCSADAVAAALYLAKYAATEVAGVLKAGFDYTGKQTADLLKKTGFPSDDVAKALKQTFDLPYNAIGDILALAGFPNQQIASAFKAIGVNTEDAIGFFRSKVGDKELSSLLETAGYPKKEIEAAFKNICGCILDVCSCVTKVCDCVTKSVCSCVTKRVCSCVLKCIHVAKPSN